MKSIMKKLGESMASLALIAAILNVNSTCVFHVYQEPIPECAKKLSKVK